MRNSTWLFSLQFNVASRKKGALGSIIFCDTKTDINRFSEISGCELKQAGPILWIDISLKEGSLELLDLVSELQRSYGLTPSETKIVPLELRDKLYSVTKQTSYSDRDLDLCDYLIVKANSVIAEHRDGSERFASSEKYVVSELTVGKKQRFGFVSPFQGVLVNEYMVKKLGDLGLVGLEFEPAIIAETKKDSKDLFKLGSSIKLPQSKTRLITEEGRHIAPLDWNNAYFDDGGYIPEEIQYCTKDFDCLGDFDIALSYERLGPTKARSFRTCVISNRLRRILQSLKNCNASFSPVKFTDDVVI